MTDEFRHKTADSLDEQKGEATELTGKPVDGRNKRHGTVDQDDERAKDAEPSAESTSEEAQREQDRQLETGQENPG